MRWGDPRRTAYGTASQAAVAAQFSWIALFNNSTGPQLLSILGITEDGNDPSVANNVVIAHGTPSGTAIAPIPAFSGETTPVGQIFTGTAASIPATSFYYVPGQGTANNPHPYPFFTLQAGWAFYLYCLIVNSQLGLSFLYQWRWVWEFPVIPNDPLGS